MTIRSSLVGFCRGLLTGHHVPFAFFVIVTRDPGMTKRSSLAGIASTLPRVKDVKMMLQRTSGGMHLRQPLCLP